MAGLEWQALFDRHSAALALFARQWVRGRADAEDVVQEAFVRLWKHEGPIENPPAYLYASVRTIALDTLRGDKRRTNRERVVMDERPTHEEPMLVSIEDDERRKAIELAMADLPHEQREVLVMKTWGGLSFKEIGEALNIPLNTAASRYRYALEGMRKTLAAEV